MDLRNPDKRPPTPLAARVMMVAFALTALAALVVARADDGRDPVGAFLQRLGVASQETDVSGALCFASVLVAGLFVVRYVVTMGGPEDGYKKQRRAKAVRRRARGLAEH